MENRKVISGLDGLQEFHKGRSLTKGNNLKKNPSSSTQD
jgi:hypothetical protein